MYQLRFEVIYPYFVAVNKPVGMSSTSVVRFFKCHLPKPVAKIGHIGTLDPFAEGVLLLGINGAQKANDLIHDNFPKVYLAKGLLGIKTKTGDHTDEMIGFNTSEETKNPPTKIEIENALKEFVGDYMQTPHAISASKFMGKRLYELNREAHENDFLGKEAVNRVIFDIELVNYNFPEVEFRVSVSSGTYVRVLFSDLAEKFSLYGHLVTLLRESVGDIHLRDSVSRNAWPLRNVWANASKIPLTDIIKLPSIVLSPHEANMFQEGVRMRLAQVFSDEYPDNSVDEKKRYWAYSPNGDLLGMFNSQESLIKIELTFRK